MRKFLLHVLLLLGAFTTFANSNPSGMDNSDNSSWCFSTIKFKNTGCQTVKIYKKSGWNMYYYKTLNPGSYYNQQCYYGNEWVFKVDGNIIGNYVVTSCTNKTCDIDTEGCGGNNGNDCGSVPTYLSGLIYMGEFNGSKYFCSNDNNNNWNEAMATNAATQYGGHLVVVNSAEENEFLRSKIMASRVWIGFTDEASEGNFKWVNGDPVTYTNWSYGEPNNQGINGGQGDHTILEKSSGKWKDRNGWDDYEFVIEIPCQAQPVCNGEISGLKIHNISGGSDLDLTDGATYQLNQLPSQFNIEATVTGNIESVKFFLSGPVNGDHNENISPYRYGGDNNAMTLTPGNYSLTVKGYSQDNSNGEKCAELTVQFTISNDPPACTSSCNREVSAIAACSGNGPYTIYLQNANGGNYFNGSGQTWEECDNGTIHYYGTAFKTQGSTNDDYIAFDLYFSGKTTVPPTDSPKPNACFGYDASTFIYYPETYGTITTPNHGTIHVLRRGPSFQLGLGANHQSPDFGASGWLDFYGSSNYYSVGDVNVALSTGCGPCALLGGDTDGDGVCDQEDCQPNDPNFPTTPGAACNDNDSSTENDRVTSDGCGCKGTPIYVLVNEEFEQCIGAEICGDVSINDYVTFNAKYEVTLQPTLGVLTLNDNGTFCYESDVEGDDEFRYQVCYFNGVDANPVICKTGISWVIIRSCDPCDNLGGDTDSDGICDQEDCQPNDPNYPATPGTACNDGNPNTENDVVQADGCSCAGTPVPVCDNVVMGGTIGFLNSCSPTIVYCKEDGDAPLIQDCFSPIGGSGNLEVVWLKSTTSCLPPTTTFANIQNDPHWVVIPNVNSLDYQPGQLSESTCFLRCSRRENCDMFIESNIVRIEVNCDLDVDCDVLTITTKVGQVIVDGLDQAPLASVQVFSPDYNTTYFTCPGNCDLPTQVIDLADGDYLVYVKFYDSSFNLICEKYGTYTVPPCQNVGLGGFIGFNNCFGSYTYCPLTEAIPTIDNCGDPEGGVGNLEVVWLRSATSCLPPTTTFENIDTDPHWEMIPGANGLSYSPTEVTQNTCFLRCVRREGCGTFVESNIISLVIDTDCLLFDRETVSIGDRVWDDYNGDGIQDADEPGLADVFVNLQDENGNSIRWTSTDADGNYIFFNQPAGSYQVVFSTPAGYEVTIAGSGSDLENDSDVDPLTGRTAIFDLVEGDHPRGIDCGFRTAGIFLRAGVNSFDFQNSKRRRTYRIVLDAQCWGGRLGLCHRAFCKR
ncbi:MAG: SdrD B-like domain-containing protein [Saprospiraceae bacterium]